MMNLKPLEKAVEVRKSEISKNGFPIFEIMIAVDTAYKQVLNETSSQSGLVWYTEDLDLIKEFKKVYKSKENNLQDEIAFMKKHSECFKLSSAVPVMSSGAQRAFNHLKTKDARKRTFKDALYGIAFLLDMEHESILVFHHTTPKLRDIFDERKNNFNEPQELKVAHLKLLQLYENNEVKYADKITAGAFEILKAQLTDYAIVTDYHKTHKLKNALSILVGVKNNIGLDLDIHIPNGREIHLTIDGKKYNLSHPKIKDSANTVDITYVDENGETVTKHKSLKGLFVFLYKQAHQVEKNINNYLSKVNKPK